MFSILIIFILFFSLTVQWIALKVLKKNGKHTNASNIFLANSLNKKTTQFTKKTMIESPSQARVNYKKVRDQLKDPTQKFKSNDSLQRTSSIYPTEIQINDWIRSIQTNRPAMTDVINRSNQSDEQLFDGFIRDLQLIRHADWENISLSPIELEQLAITMDWLNHYYDLERPELMRLKNNLDRLQQKVYYFQHNHSEEYSAYTQKRQSADRLVGKNEFNPKVDQQSMEYLRKTAPKTSFNLKNRRELIKAYEILSVPVSIRRRSRR